MFIRIVCDHVTVGWKFQIRFRQYRGNSHSAERCVHCIVCEFFPQGAVDAQENFFRIFGVDWYCFSDDVI